MFCRSLTDGIIADAEADHVDAHVRGRFVGRCSLNLFENRAEYRENSDVAVVVDDGRAIGFEVEGVDLIDVVEVGGRRFVSQVDGVIERQIPDRESLEFSITGFDAALVFMIKL